MQVMPTVRLVMCLRRGAGLDAQFLHGRQHAPDWLLGICIDVETLRKRDDQKSVLAENS